MQPAGGAADCSSAAPYPDAAPAGAPAAVPQDAAAAEAERVRRLAQPVPEGCRRLALLSRRNLEELFVGRQQMAALCVLEKRLRGGCTAAAPTPPPALRAIPPCPCRVLPLPTQPYVKIACLQCTADLRAQEGRPHASPLEGAIVRIKRGGSRELHRVQAVYEFRGQLRLRLQV
jgi:hypothetical protein